MMWLFSASIVVCMSWYAEAAASDVVIECDSCKGKGTSLAGDLGGNLSVLFTVNKEKFGMLTIYYNGTRNKILMIPYLNVVNVKGVTDKRRFVIPKKLTKGENKWSVRITLINLSMADDGLKFSYEYLDDKASKHKGASTITVNVGPTFDKPLDKELTVEIANKFHVAFSLRANPKPTKVSARFGPHDLIVKEVGSGQYVYHYEVDGGFLKKEWCGYKFELTAIGFKTLTSTSDVKLLFIPDVPQGVAAHRAKNKKLYVSWTPLTYGTCLVRYHVRYNTQNATVDHRTSAPSTFGVIFRILSVGNITVNVNAEVNGRSGPYGDPIFIQASLVPTQRPSTTTEAGFLQKMYMLIVTLIKDNGVAWRGRH